jgi:hypothetical protein
MGPIPYPQPIEPAPAPPVGLLARRPLRRAHPQAGTQDCVHCLPVLLPVRRHWRAGCAEPPRRSLDGRLPPGCGPARNPGGLVPGYIKDPIKYYYHYHYYYYYYILQSLGATQAIRLCNSYPEWLDGVLAPPNLLLVPNAQVKSVLTQHVDLGVNPN